MWKHFWKDTSEIVNSIPLGREWDGIGSCSERRHLCFIHFTFYILSYIYILYFPVLSEFS